MDLMEKREQLEGTKISEILFNLATLRYTVDKNYEELSAAINYIEPFLSVPDIKMFNACFREISRLLHNYLSSNYSLIGQYRKLSKDLNCQKLNEGYSEKINALNMDEHVRFINDLRTSAQHVGLPILLAHFSRKTRDSQLEQKILLHKKTLLTKWKKWNPASRSFIDSHENIDLKTVLAEHQSMTTAFYKWFCEAVTNLYSKQLNELTEINYKLTKCSPFKENKIVKQKEVPKKWRCVWNCSFDYESISVLSRHEITFDKKKAIH